MGEILLAAAAGVLVGILSALFGVGGGILMVPFMVLVLERGQHLAEGTSLLVMIVTAVIGSLGHAKRGYVSFNAAALLGIGGIGGSILGAIVALETSGATLQRLFAGLVMFSGIRLIWKSVSDTRRTGTTQT